MKCSIFYHLKFIRVNVLCYNLDFVNLLPTAKTEHKSVCLWHPFEFQYTLLQYYSYSYFSYKNLYLYLYTQYASLRTRH